MQSHLYFNCLKEWIEWKIASLKQPSCITNENTQNAYRFVGLIIWAYQQKRTKNASHVNSVHSHQHIINFQHISADCKTNHLNGNSRTDECFLGDQSQIHYLVDHERRVMTLFPQHMSSIKQVYKIVGYDMCIPTAFINQLNFCKGYAQQ